MNTDKIARTIRFANVFIAMAIALFGLCIALAVASLALGGTIAPALIPEAGKYAIAAAFFFGSALLVKFATGRKVAANPAAFTAWKRAKRQDFLTRRGVDIEDARQLATHDPITLKELKNIARLYAA